MNKGIFYRSFELKRDALDIENRTVSLSFSSETLEVTRYTWEGEYIEILDHNPRAVDLSRLKSVGAFIYGHDSSKIIGPIKSVKTIGGRNEGVVGIDETEEGNLRLIQFQSGSLKGISVGYHIFKMKELAEGETYKLASMEVVGKKDKRIMIITRWQPIEISATPVPADTSIGIGREISLEGIEIESSRDNSFQQLRYKKGETMDPKEVQKMIDDNNQRQETFLRKIISEILIEDKKPKMSIPLDISRKLLSRAAAFGPETEAKVAQKIILEGRTEHEVSDFLFDQMLSRNNTRDSGEGADDDGTGRHPQHKKQATEYRNILDIPDDLFKEAICNPTFVKD